MRSDFRDHFSIPREICYLNASYMTPQPKVVVDAAIEGANRRSEPWRIAPADFFNDVEALRAEYARLVSCPADNIAIVPSAGYGVACAAANIAIDEGQVILAMADQFPSNHYSWRRQTQVTGAEIYVVQKSPNRSWTESLLSAVEQLGDRIALATLEGHHWSTAETVDLEQVLPALKDIGARTVLDLTQSVGAFPTDVRKLAPDFMLAAGYKWQFCPYGVSFMYVDEQYFDGVPIEEPWINRDGAEDFSRLAEFTDLYQAGARRYDVSETPSFSNIAGALAAIRLLNDWGTDTVSETLADTNRRVANIVTGYGFETMREDQRAPHFQAARLPDADAESLAAGLLENGVVASVRGEFLRLAPHVYNDEEDLARLSAALSTVLG